MNDIISLDSVRRAHQRPSARRAGADATAEPEGPELEATAQPIDSSGGWYVPPTDAGGASRKRSSAHPAGRALRPAPAKAEPTTPVGPATVDSDPAAVTLEPTAVEKPRRAAPAFAPVVELPVQPELSDEERLAAISDTVIRALGRRQLSAGEARELLITQGAEPDEAETLVARYEELGYLDDQALAESLVERLSERNHKSRGVIARELSARKIPSEIVSIALEQLDDDHEFGLALDAATKRIGQLSSYDDQTAERRLVGFLTRRGFASAVVREVTRRAMASRKSFGGPRFR